MTATERIELWKHELDLKNWKYNVLKNGNTIVYDTTDGATTFVTALADFTDISVRGIGHISEDQYGHMMFAINRFNGRILPVHRFFIDDDDNLSFRSVCFDQDISFDYLVQVIYGMYCSPEAIVKHLAG